MGPAVRRALAVAVASLLLQEKCKCSCLMGLLGEAIMCQDQQVWLTGPNIRYIQYLFCCVSFSWCTSVDVMLIPA